jgi:hypothetical protein
MAPSRFAGTLKKVEIDLAPEKLPRRPPRHAE